MAKERASSLAKRESHEIVSPLRWLSEWNPWREIEDMKREMDRAFRSLFGYRPFRWFDGFESQFSPGVEMYETEKDVVISVPLPGVNREDIDVSITDDTITISAERKEEDEKAYHRYWMRDHAYGSFRTTLRLPVEVKSDKAKAAFKNGILEVTIPKAHETKAKRIKVES